jgi:hypothetical protein
MTLMLLLNFLLTDTMSDSNRPMRVSVVTIRISWREDLVRVTSPW